MKIIDYIQDNIPSWSLSYFVNGDASGLEDSEIAEADAWMRDCEVTLAGKYPDGIIQFETEPDCESYFSRNPAFGLAGDCVNGALFVMVPNESEADEIELPW